MCEYKERLLGRSAWICMDVISLICMQNPISAYFSRQGESHNPTHQSFPFRSQLILKEFLCSIFTIWAELFQQMKRNPSA